MANYSSLISAMEAVIRQNGNQEITGTILQTVLRSIILELGAEFQFGGVATPDTNPNTPDYNVAYIAGAGTYINFDNQTIPAGKIGIFKNRGAESGTWALQTFDISLGANSVSESNIQNGAVTENKIADNSVSTDKIKDKNVTRDKLSDGLTDELDNKANINGFYSTLGAGVAQNLVGRGDVPAEYTFRTAGGSADIGSGTALIKMLKGRTLVWNQLFDASPETAFTITEGASYPPVAESASAYDIVSGHKYFCLILISTTSGTLPQDLYFTWKQTGDFKLTPNVPKIIQATQNARIGANTGSLRVYSSSVNAFSGKFSVSLIDLTLMFGAGNEPSTPEEFEALFPLDYYAYNAGQLISVTATGIKTVGFNQWDEEWENGYWNVETGQAVAQSTYIRCKNFIPVFPSTTYYMKSPSIEVGQPIVIYFDASGNIISYKEQLRNKTFTTPANCAKIKFYDKLLNSGTAVYANDICINLSWSGYRNGEYEPYWSEELALPITTLTGKKDGEGESVAMFADGLKSARSAFDEIVGNGAVKRIGKVDLGSLDWFYSSNPYSPGASIGPNFYATINGAKNDNDNPIVISSKYVGLSAAYAYTHNEDMLVIIEDGSNIKIKDSAYTDAATFKAAMLGVYLYYELATPETYVLDSELGLNYRVDDFGTEMELPQNDDEPVTAPIRYDVQYAMNAVDTLRRLPENYISKESFEDFLAEFDSKLGAALNATIVSTMTFNSETQKYGFNITITPNNP